MSEYHPPFGVAETELQIVINAPLPRTWQALTQELSQWWPKSFCTDPDRAQAMRIEFQLGGRVYEDWGNGDGWTWWTIFKLDAAHHRFAVIGYEETSIAHHAITFTLTADGAATTLHIADRTWGAIIPGDVIDSHREGWKQLFEGAFKPYAETSAR